MDQMMELQRQMNGMIRDNARRITQMGKALSGGVGAAKNRPFPWMGGQMPVLNGMPKAAQGADHPDHSARSGAAQKAADASKQKIEKKPPQASRETRITKELKSLLDPGRYAAPNLSEQDLRYIVGQYGSAVENIYELAAGQMWMLEAVKRVKSAFYLQILTKAVIKLDLPAFRQQAEEVCRKHESLRSVFVVNHVERPYRVILKDRVPEINCFDFSDLSMEEFDEKIRACMETDRKRGFRLERDSLLRISIYKSCEEDTYAIVISQPHINSDGTSLGILFRDLFIGYVLDMNGIDQKIEKQSYQSYANYLYRVDTEKELDFWKNALKDIDEDQLLPGQQSSSLEYDSASLFVPFEEAERKALQDAVRTFKVTQFTILQGLWGIAMARLKRRHHMVFGAITAGRDAEVSGSMTMEGGFVNAIPVVIRFDDGETMESFFQRVQASFLEYLNNSHVAPNQIRESIGRKRPVFSHMLNNHNFATPKGSGFAMGGMPGVQIIGGDVYDNLSEDLCVYFTMVEGHQGCNYSYNSRAFSRDVIQIFAEYFKKMLLAIGEYGKDDTIGLLPVVDSGMIDVVQDARQVETIKIAGFLKRNPLFRDAGDEELLELAQNCHMESYDEDEIIIKKDENVAGLPILLHGRCTVFEQTREGWNNPVRMLKAGQILNYSCLFEGVKANHTVVAASSGVTTVSIPRTELMQFLSLHPMKALEISRALYEERNIFVQLWTNAV